MHVFEGQNEFLLIYCSSISYFFCSEKEKRSLAKQLSLSYSAMKSTEIPVHLYVTSFNKESLAGQCLKQQGRKY